jgi:hypothetical protein
LGKVFFVEDIKPYSRAGQFTVDVDSGYREQEKPLIVDPLEFSRHYLTN